MPSIKSIHKQRPKKRFEIPGAVVRWGIIAIVAVVMAVVVSGALSRAPVEPAPASILGSAQTDLVSLTRMLGDVELDSSTRSLFPPSLGPKLTAADSLLREGQWHELLTTADKLLKKATPDEVPALRGLSGLAFERAASPDHALRQFKKGLAKADSINSGLAPWLAFSVAFLYQGRGFTDSCLAYYAKSEQALGATADPRLLAIANNSGVAYEAQKDTARAAGQYRRALALVDSVADPKTARLVRENLARVSPGR